MVYDAYLGAALPWLMQPWCGTTIVMIVAPLSRSALGHQRQRWWLAASPSPRICNTQCLAVVLTVICPPIPRVEVSQRHESLSSNGWWRPNPRVPPTCDILSITTCLDIADSVGSAKPTVDCWINRSDKTSTRACHGFNSRERQTVVMAQSTSESSSRLL